MTEVRPAALPALVTPVEPLGAETILRLKLPGVDGEVLARVPRVAQAVAGDHVGLSFDPAHTHLFDPINTTRL